MTLDITLNQLRYFREVARQGQFTRAAEALFVSQPAVSRCIKDLERQVGSPLFEAIGRRVRLTQAGVILHEHAERILAELEDAGRALRNASEGKTGPLIIGASNTPGTYLLPELLARFQRTHPAVEPALVIGDTGTIVKEVLEGRLDLGVVGETEFVPALTVELFRKENLVLILAPDHPLAAIPQIAMIDLLPHPFVLREPGSSTREVVERALRTHISSSGHRLGHLRVIMELGSTEAVKKTVAAGLAVSFVSEHAVDLEVRAGALVVRGVEGINPSRGLYVVRRKTLHLSPLHQRFLAALYGKAHVDQS